MQHAANSFHISHRHGSSSVKSAWIGQLLQHHHSGSTSYLQHEGSQVRFVTNIKTWLRCFLLQGSHKERQFTGSISKYDSVSTFTDYNYNNQQYFDKMSSFTRINLLHGFCVSLHYTVYNVVFSGIFFLVYYYFTANIMLNKIYIGNTN